MQLTQQQSLIYLSRDFPLINQTLPIGVCTSDTFLFCHPQLFSISPTAQWAQQLGKLYNSMCTFVITSQHLWETLILQTQLHLDLSKEQIGKRFVVKKTFPHLWSPLSSLLREMMICLDSDLPPVYTIEENLWMLSCWVNISSSARTHSPPEQTDL